VHRIPELELTFAMYYRLVETVKKVIFASGKEQFGYREPFALRPPCPAHVCQITRNPNFTRDQEAQELRSQLDRLEGLLTMLGGDGAGLLATGGVKQPEVAAAEALEMLSVRLVLGDLGKARRLIIVCHRELRMLGVMVVRL
jgi:hypothetical protein